MGTRILCNIKEQVYSYVFLCNLHVIGHMFAWLLISLYFWLGIILLSSIKGNGGHSPDPRHTRHFYILLSPPSAGRILHVSKRKILLSLFCVSFFVYFFGGLPLCWPLLCLCHPFCIFERCLDSNPESCRSKQARYQLSHPSPSNLATHLPNTYFFSLLSNVFAI